jgi:hypothetical protein
MLAASSGLGVAYLGPDLPAREIVESAASAGAHVLVLGLTGTSAGKATNHELRTIVRDLPKGVELWAGGRGAGRPRGFVFSLGPRVPPSAFRPPPPHDTRVLLVRRASYR